MSIFIDDSILVSHWRSWVHMTVPNLLQIVQRETKQKNWADLCIAIRECEKLYVYNSDTQIDYKFAELFEHVMSQNGAHFKIQDVELYDYILYEPGEYKDRNYSWHDLLTQFCVTGSQLQCMYVDRDPQEYQNELFMQFMTFVKSFN